MICWSGGTGDCVVLLTVQENVPAEYFLSRGDSPVETLGAPPKNLETKMKNFAKKVQRFLASEDGPTAVEYAVMLALIVIVCLTAIRAIGTNAQTTFQNIADQIAG